MTPTFYDVVVVGAGPAGARTARDLARQGLEVLLVEEHKRIGEPCHCSGLVSPRTLEVAQAGDDLIFNVINGATFHTPGGASLRLSSPAVCAYVIDRVELDRRLVQQAVQEGVTMLKGTEFLRFRLESDAEKGRGAVVVTLQEQDRRFEVSAALLVGADGASSRVAGQLRGGRAGSLIRAMGGQAEYQGNDLPDHAQVFLDEQAAPGWFGWTIPLGVGTARVGVGTTNGIRPIQSMAMLGRHFPDSFGKARLIDRRAGLIPLWEPGQLFAERVILVGDAARQVKPASGGGILTALASGALAAKAAGKALRSGDLSARGLAPYAKLWHQRVGAELQRQHDMRRALNHLDEQRIERLLQALQRPALKESVEISGDIDVPSRLVWRILLRQPSLMLDAAVLPQFPLAWLRFRTRELFAAGSAGPKKRKRLSPATQGCKQPSEGT